jgi:hypothetical protein
VNVAALLARAVFFDTHVRIEKHSAGQQRRYIHSLKLF